MPWLDPFIRAGRTFLDVLSAPVEEIVIDSVMNPESLTIPREACAQVAVEGIEQAIIGISSDGWWDIDAAQVDHDTRYHSQGG